MPDLHKAASCFNQEKRWHAPGWFLKRANNLFHSLENKKNKYIYKKNSVRPAVGSVLKATKP